MLPIDITLAFAEWMDLNAIRKDKNLWYFVKDSTTSKWYTTREMLKIFLAKPLEHPETS